MYLDDSIFSKIIEHAPLVSIDLIVCDKKQRVLLGERNNRPAKGFWFVPGGRIRKNESLEVAFKRITFDELGVELSILDATLLGPYTHLYNDSVYGDEVTTHYVAIAYQLEVNEEALHLPKGEQHSSYHWLDKAELLLSDVVHSYTKLYFE